MDNRGKFHQYRSCNCQGKNFQNYLHWFIIHEMAFSVLFFFFFFVEPLPPLPPKCSPVVMKCSPQVADENDVLSQPVFWQKFSPLARVNRNFYIAYIHFWICQVSLPGYYPFLTLPGRNLSCFLFHNSIGSILGGLEVTTQLNKVRLSCILGTGSHHSSATAMLKSDFFDHKMYPNLAFLVQLWPLFTSWRWPNSILFLLTLVTMSTILRFRWRIFIVTTTMK